MSIRIVVCRDFDSISERAAGFVSSRISSAQGGRDRDFVLGLRHPSGGFVRSRYGGSPTLEYAHLAVETLALLDELERVEGASLRDLADRCPGMPEQDPGAIPAGSGTKIDVAGRQTEIGDGVHRQPRVPLITPTLPRRHPWTRRSR